MGLKKTILRLLPSYRAKDAILDEICQLSSSLRSIEVKLDNLKHNNEYFFYCLQHLDDETLLETKQRVFLHLPKAGGEIQDFQIAANYILQRVKRICEKEGIEFFLDWGTLLGAVRHQGFIPWDDDVDVGIMRDDYYRLMSAVNKDPELEMHRYYRYTRPGIEAGYVTKIKLRCSDLFFVDVFPLDMVPIVQENVDKTWHESELMCEAFHNELNELFIKNGFPVDCCVPTRYPEIDIKVRDLEYTYCNAIISSYPKSNMTSNYLWCGVDQLAFLRRTRKAIPEQYFFPLIQNGACFEGEQYSIPKETDWYLRTVYGDYMSFPAKIQQVHIKELTKIDENNKAIIERIKMIDRNETNE